MYSDPSLIRKHVIKVSLSDREAKLIDALCEYSGEAKAVFVRDLLMTSATSLLRADEVVSINQYRNGTN